ncbi:FtsH protease activity modulator HflK [Diaphorobacter caeni]|uniref:FtsH protease activity modulator HflK n=1 Tax=Diaphorobacter caeni TaxID=2784387 RepID=UPI00188DE96C|nr:FtsH protease activity modulator HflK [Diaphorobacter caeni]MBF5007181.1 FtsH protease activity modulator HflK [Diaphorobacter caeni]
MNSDNIAFRWATLPQRIRGMFNLNDPRWGRGDDKSDGGGSSPSDNNQQPRPPQNNGQQPPDNRQRGQGNNNGGGGGQPPDLDEMFRDLNRKLSGLFGGGNKGSNNNGGNGGGFQPGMKGTGIGIGVIAVVAAMIWLGTGVFIVQEGQQAVITQFGKYKSTVGAGLNWRLPYPVQKHELVYVTRIRSSDVGRDSIIKSTGLRESAMLTEDENIVEIKFAVQYRLSDARAWLFESRDPEGTVVQVAETAVREVVGKMKMDLALADERDQIAPRVRELMQTILDRYKIGVEIVGINLQQGGVRPPEQVQASFDDVLKAGQERERLKNLAQAYANDVIPRAAGSASRLAEEAEGYKAKIVATAQGDAGRFSSVLTEYQKAPQVTRDRMYVDTMQQIYSNATKVVVESSKGSNLLYLPLDKIMQSVSQASNNAVSAESSAPAAPAAATSATVPNVDPRARDSNRSRERDAR